MTSPVVGASWNNILWTTFSPAVDFLGNSRLGKSLGHSRLGNILGLSRRPNQELTMIAPTQCPYYSVHDHAYTHVGHKFTNELTLLWSIVALCLLLSVRMGLSCRKNFLRLLTSLALVQLAQATDSRGSNPSMTAPIMFLLKSTLCLGALYIIAIALLQAYRDHQTQMSAEVNPPKKALSQALREVIVRKEAKKVEQAATLARKHDVLLSDQQENSDTDSAESKPKLSKNEKRRAQYARAAAKDLSCSFYGRIVCFRNFICCTCRRGLVTLRNYVKSRISHVSSLCNQLFEAADQIGQKTGGSDNLKSRSKVS